MMSRDSALAKFWPKHYRHQNCQWQGSRATKYTGGLDTYVVSADAEGVIGLVVLVLEFRGRVGQEAFRTEIISPVEVIRAQSNSP